jgi:peptide subunit release factor 1 (eRF1)
VFLNVNPARPENRGKAYVLRLKDALKDKKVPQALVERVLEYVDRERLQTHTLVLFSTSDDLFEVHKLHVELLEEVRWGEPFVAPLVVAIDEYQPSGVVLLDAEKFRFFVTSLEEIEEKLDAVNLFSTAGWREMTLSPSTALPRGGADKDVFRHRLEAQTQRFYRGLGETVRQLVDQLKLQRLILAGPEERTAAFLSTLPQEVQDLVAETIHLPAGASEAEVMERISSVEERIERRQEEQLLIAARERGVHGLQNTLEALQEGRVYHLLVPWPLDREARWCYACATVSLDASEEVCPSCGGPTRARPLASVLLNLATDRGARIEFMSGENAENLREEFGGLAGLVRF